MIDGSVKELLEEAEKSIEFWIKLVVDAQPGVVLSYLFLRKLHLMRHADDPCLPLARNPLNSRRVIAQVSRLGSLIFGQECLHFNRLLLHKLLHRYAHHSVSPITHDPPKCPYLTKH
jgi:hypothetical protein